MGNYLPSYRAPPANEDERDQPYYYDWSVPQSGLFRETSSEKTSSDRAPSKPTGQTISNNDCVFDAARTSMKELEKCTNESPGELRKEVENLLKERLTSIEDVSSEKPPNLRLNKPSQIAKSTVLYLRKQHSSNIGLKEATVSANNSIKTVDYTRPHTIDARKYGNIDDQAAIKAATNIHAIRVAKKSNS